MYSYISTSNNYLCYASQEKRSCFPFNLESIKKCFIRLGDNSIPNRKIWIDVEQSNDGQLECIIRPSSCCYLTRLMWDQSALELKCRDKEFIPLLLQAFKESSKEEKEKIILGLGYQENLYRDEKKFRHAKFFNDLINFLN